MFRNLRITIFVYYFTTVSSLIGFCYYNFIIQEFVNLYVIAIVIFMFIILSGVFISKLSIDPLQEYVHNLQMLSKETLHELNLPISTIVTNTQMLEKSIDDEKNLKRIARINTACEMLKERYNELEYMIKKQSKQNIKEHFSVNELLCNRVEFLSKIYPHISFNLEVEKFDLFGDRKGLSKVIDNLIDNGVKYSNNSKVIDVKIKENSLYIQDYGIGMDEVELVHIFDKYYQSNSSMQGFGIGLSMVKRFCDNNDIKLSFKSSPNVGTIVELKFKNI